MKSSLHFAPCGLISLTPVLIISHPKTEWWWLMSLWIREIWGDPSSEVLLLVQAGLVHVPAVWPADDGWNV